MLQRLFYYKYRGAPTSPSLSIISTNEMNCPYLLKTMSIPYIMSSTLDFSLSNVEKVTMLLEYCVAK